MVGEGNHRGLRHIVGAQGSQRNSVAVRDDFFSLQMLCAVKCPIMCRIKPVGTVQDFLVPYETLRDFPIWAGWNHLGITRLFSGTLTNVFGEDGKNFPRAPCAPFLSLDFRVQSLEHYEGHLGLFSGTLLDCEPRDRLVAICIKIFLRAQIANCKFLEIFGRSKGEACQYLFQLIFKPLNY